MQNKYRYLKNKWFIVLGIFLILIDQLVKFLILIKYRGLLFFNFNSVFGIRYTWVDFLIFFIILGLIYYFFLYPKNQVKNQFIKLGFTLVLSGGISNFIDKIARGYVIDFINIKTSAFNFADIIIIIGALILIWQILYEKNSTSCKNRK